MQIKKIVILISGRGSNMQAILEACIHDHWPTRIAKVISNYPEAKGLKIAKKYGILTQTIDHRLYETRNAFDKVLANAIDDAEPDLIVLAGFMRILTDVFVNRYIGRMINIHPSLLPSFKGLGTHQRALKAGVRWHGTTVHFVSATLDGGPIIAQCAVPVFPDDNARTLEKRVLKAENILYPRIVREYIDEHIRLINDSLLCSPYPNFSLSYIYETNMIKLIQKKTTDGQSLRL